MIRLIATLLTFWIPREKLRRTCRKRIISFWYSLPVRWTVKRCGACLRCGGPVHLTKHTELADHVWIHGLWASGNGRLLIGRYVHLGEGLRIFTRNHNYNCGDAIPYDTTYIKKDVVIGDFVWIGVQVILLPGTKIGEGAIIQAGSVVHGEIPPYAIAGGNPAKVFAQRDVEHFQQLKAAGKFH